MVFYTKKQDATDQLTIETLNYWTGFILLMATGTLLYTTMIHILPEVYFGHGDDHHHFEAPTAEAQAYQAPSLNSEDKQTAQQEP